MVPTLVFQPRLSMQEMAFTSVKGRRAALRMQFYAWAQSEYLVLSPRTSQKMECFPSHPELNKGQFSHQASGSLCLSTSRDRKPLFL